MHLKQDVYNPNQNTDTSTPGASNKVCIELLNLIWHRQSVERSLYNFFKLYIYKFSHKLGFSLSFDS